jgi:hypothetical protein
MCKVYVINSVKLVETKGIDFRDMKMIPCDLKRHQELCDLYELAEKFFLDPTASSYQEVNFTYAQLICDESFNIHLNFQVFQGVKEQNNNLYAANRFREFLRKHGRPEFLPMVQPLADH